MPDPLLRYLLELAEDPIRARRFRADPDADLALTDLTVEQKAILRSREPARLRAALVGTPPEGDLVLLAWLASLWSDAAEPGA